MGRRRPPRGPPVGILPEVSGPAPGLATKHQHRHGHHQGGGGENHSRFPGDIPKDRCDLEPEGVPHVLQVLLERVQHGCADIGRDAHELLPVGQADGAAFQHEGTEANQQKANQKDGRDLRARAFFLIIVSQLPGELTHRRILPGGAPTDISTQGPEQLTRVCRGVEAD
jgi:hypothetical protein